MNVFLKIVGSIAIVAALAAAAGSSLHRHLIGERVGGDKLIWSDDEAYYFALHLREGWSGNLLELTWEYVRAYFYQAGTISNRRSALVVTRFTSSGTSRTVIPDTDSFPYFFYNGSNYGMHRGSLAKWVDGRLEAVGDEEASQARGHFSGGVFTNVNGWSSTVNVAGRFPGEYVYPLVLDGVPVTVTAELSRTLKRVTVQYPGRSRETILELHADFVAYDRATYAKRFAPGDEF